MNKGLRLKKIILEKYNTSKDFAIFMGWSKQKLDYYYKKEDLTEKALTPILQKLNITYEDFLGKKKNEDYEVLRLENEKLKAENNQLLRDKIALYEKVEMIEIENKKNRIRTKNVV